MLAATLTINMVGGVLLRKAANQNVQQVTDLSASLSNEITDASFEKIHGGLIDAARQMGGRLFLVDRDAKVIFDTFDERCGTLLPYGEVQTVLSGESDADYGYHAHRLDGAADGAQRDGEWEGCFASAVLDESGRTIAVIAALISIQDTIDTVYQLRNNIGLVFLVALAVVLLLSALILSGLITRPINALSAGIDRMAQGDYGTMVHVPGHGEMANLAAAFNEMSEKVHRLDESRSQFVSNASHELKTPLATIKILVETMLYQEGADEAFYKELLQDIDSEIDRLSAVVSDLLILAKADSRKLTIRRERIDFESVVRKSVDRLMPLADKKEIAVNLDITDPCVMEADSAKLMQVCYNIISNAIKYTPREGRIDVKLRRTGRDAVLEVSDTGVGIAEADLPHVFDRFYRADRSRAREEEGTGTGLGLSIVRQIVRLHAGTVTVRSKPGEGSTFTVQLPVL